MKITQRIFPFTILLFLSTLIFVGCKSEDDNQDDNTPGTPVVENGITLTSVGSLKLNFNHVYGNNALQLSPQQYVTVANDTIKITQLTYYITDVVLTNKQGAKIKLGNANLVKFIPPGASSFTLNNVPAGTYTAISYLIGVDSTRNSTGTNEGDLDPSYGMYWSWNTGYVFVRLKGRFSAMETAFTFDIGGTPNIMSASHSLLSYQKSGSNATLDLNVDVERIFNTPNVYDLKVDDISIHDPTVASIQKLKPNITSAFSLKSVN